MTRIFHITIFLLAGILANGVFADNKNSDSPMIVQQTGAKQKPLMSVAPVTAQIEKVEITSQDLIAQRMRDFINQLKTKGPDGEV